MKFQIIITDNNTNQTLGIIYVVDGVIQRSSWNSKDIKIEVKP